MSRTVTLRPALVVAAAAAVLAPALELASGQPLSYLLVLTGLGVALLLYYRLGRGEFGWRPGRAADHALALAYPLAAVGALALAAWVKGDLDLSGFVPGVTARRLGLMFASTLPAVLITEEGFFRGALWGLLRRAQLPARGVLAVSSLAFCAWHLAVPLIERDFLLPTAQLPVYYLNVLLLGTAWGLLRLVSGSVLVACTAHAWWNTLVYVGFGYGVRGGVLGITGIGTFDPERGVLGLTVNLAAVVLLLRWARRRGTAI